MPREHARILVSIWDDQDFIALSSHAQRLYMLLLTQRTINNAGILPTQISKWAKRGADTTLADIETALTELAQSRFVACDEYTEETLVRSFVRNDGIVNNGNVFKNALRCAEAVESTQLRAVLAIELRRLGHPEADKTADRIDPDETPSERTVTPFERRSDDRERRSNAQGEGEGSSKTTVYENSPLKAATRARTHVRASAPPREATPEPDLDQPGPPAPIDGWKLVRDRIPEIHTQPVRTALAIEAATLLRAGTPALDIEAALDLWLTKPGRGPRVLPNLVSDVIRTRTAPTTRTTGPRKLTAREQAHIDLELMKDNPNPDVLRQFGIDPTTAISAAKIKAIGTAS
ncbi:hypothetical protein ACFO5K_04055 [Nocardia halotolerans]|uniref:Uncharacterized protein n=1 Tax=Nocardia halotolerans TaxID=1755878 RepID=A0ABV8VCF4_9NOCA